MTCYMLHTNKYIYIYMYANAQKNIIYVYDNWRLKILITRMKPRLPLAASSTWMMIPWTNISGFSFYSLVHGHPPKGVALSFYKEVIWPIWPTALKNSHSEFMISHTTSQTHCAPVLLLVSIPSKAWDANWAYWFTLRCLNLKKSL